MSKERRRYAKEFELEIVHLTLNRGSNVSETACHLGIRHNILNRWVRRYKADKEHCFLGQGKLKEPDEELRRLRKELLQAKIERDILKRPWPFSQNRPNEIPIYAGPSGVVSGEEDMPSC